MRWKGGSGLLAAALALPLLAAETSHLLARDGGAQHLDISARPIEHFKIGSSETRFGPLEFVRGLELTSSSWDFGALSAIRFTDGGMHFIGVADTGFWYFGNVTRDDEGRPTGFTDFRMQSMVDDQGKVIGEKWLTDAEGLGVRDGVATVGFERDHRVSEFRIDPGSMKGPVRNIDFLVPTRELRQNRGFETVTYSPGNGRLGGARVLVTEKSLDKDGNIFAAIVEGPRKGIFKVARIGDFDVTDGAFLPDGDLLLLERSFSMARGVGLRLRRIKADTIAPGKLADGPVILQADMSYQIDNMEGLDVWRRADGATMVSIVSDDNHSLLQRNLYLEFVLREE